MRRLRRRRTPAPQVDERLTAALLSATGGAGRSTTCYLLAAQFAAVSRTVVLDGAPDLASPWDSWLTRPGADSLPPSDFAGGTPSAQQVYAASGTVDAGDGADFAVIPGPRAASGNRGHHTVARAQQLLRKVTARVALVDTTTPLLNALAASDTGHADSLGWLTSPGVVPILCVPASAKGVTDALTAVNALEQQGLGAGQLHVAVVSLAASDVPRRVLAGLTLLEPRVAAVVRVPHDPWLRATSKPCAARVSSRLRDAIGDLAHQLTIEPTPLQTAEPSNSANPSTEGESNAVARSC
jgi:hypothetical protein